MGAACATVTVVLFFCAGAAPVLLVDRSGYANPMALPVALTSYALRVVLLVLGLRAAVAVTHLDSRAFGFTVLVCSAAWTLGTVIAVTGRSSRRRAASPFPSRGGRLTER